MSRDLLPARSTIAMALVVSIVLLVVAARSEAGAPPPVHAADTVLFNGKVITADNDDPSKVTVAAAIAVADGKILQVGKTSDVMKLAGPDATKIDLKGKTVLPGIIDTHTHQFEQALTRFADDLAEQEPLLQQTRPRQITATSVSDALAQIQASVSAAPDGNWLAFRILPQDVARQMELQLTYHDIDAISPKNPVIVNMTGSNRFYNSLVGDAVLKRYGHYYVDLVDAKGNYDGFADTGFQRLLNADILVQHPFSSLAFAYSKEAEYTAQFGVTTWSSVVAPLITEPVYADLDRRGEIVLRFAYSHFMGAVANPGALDFYPRLGDIAGHGTDHIWNIGIAASALDGTGANMCTSLETIPPELKSLESCEGRLGDFKGDVLRTGVKAGLRVAGTHVAGDAALDHALDIIEQPSLEAGMTYEQIRAKQHSFDHCSLNPRPDQLERVKRLGILFSCGPRYLEDASRISTGYVGGQEAANNWVEPVKSLLSTGLHVAGHTDRELTSDRNLFYDMRYLFTRQDSAGRTWGAHEAVDRMTALLMFTRWAAQYVLRPNDIGSLETGKFADLSIIDQDFMTVPNAQFANTKVLMSMVGGKLVYTEPGFAHAEGLPDVGYRA